MVIILFGVTGSGKTTIGRLLSGELGWKFYDADDFHTPANIEKMKRAIPLTDEDRKLWLERLRELISDSLAQRIDMVLACSALKEAYRKYLRVNDEVKFVFLKGDFKLIQERLKNRRGHFINPALLPSQFFTLEESQGKITVVDVAPSPAVIVRKIRDRIGI